MSIDKEVVIIIKSKDEATQKIERLRKELDKLGGEEMVKLNRQTDEYNRKIAYLKGDAGFLQKHFGELASAVKAAALAYAGLEGVRAVINFVKDTTAAAAEEEKQWNRVTAALQQHGLNVQKQLPIIQEMTDRLELQTGQADTLISQGFIRLTASGMNVSESYRTISLAAQLAAGAQMDLSTAIVLMVKAYNGQTEALGRYGITLSDSIPKAERFKVLQEELNRQFGGQANAAMGGYAGAVAQLAIEWTRVKEAIGQPLIDFLTVGIQKVRGLYTDLDTEIPLEQALAKPAAIMAEMVDEHERVIKVLEEGRQRLVAAGNDEAVRRFDDRIGDLQLRVEALRTELDKPWPKIAEGVYSTDEYDEDIEQLNAVGARWASIRVRIKDDSMIRAITGGANKLRKDFEDSESLDSDQEESFARSGSRDGLRRRNEELREQTAELKRVRREAEQEYQQQIQKTANTIQGTLSPTVTYLTQQHVTLEGVMRSLGNSIANTFVNIAVEAVSMWIAKQIVATSATVTQTAANYALAQSYDVVAASANRAADAQGGSGAGSGGSGFGGFSLFDIGKTVLSFMPFDNPRNDNLMVREGERIADFLLTGMDKSIKRAQASADGRRFAAAQPVVVHQYYGVTEQNFARTQGGPKLSLASRRKQTKIVSVESVKYGNSRVFKEGRR